MIESEVLAVVNERKVVVISDIAKALEIGHRTASDIIKRLEKQGKVKVDDRKIAKIVTPVEQVDRSEYRNQHY